MNTKKNGLRNFEILMTITIFLVRWVDNGVQTEEYLGIDQARGKSNHVFIGLLSFPLAERVRFPS